MSAAGEVGKPLATMPGWELQGVLDEIADTGEIVVRLRPQDGEADELLAAWRLARDEANAALEHWRALGGRDARAVWRAAEDRADAAQDALAVR